MLSRSTPATAERPHLTHKPKRRKQPMKPPFGCTVKERVYDWSGYLTFLEVFDAPAKASRHGLEQNLVRSDPKTLKPTRTGRLRFLPTKGQGGYFVGRVPNATTTQAMRCFDSGTFRFRF